MKKRILSIILTLAMCLSLLPTAAFAANTTVSTGDQFLNAITNASDGDTITISNGGNGISIPFVSTSGDDPLVISKAVTITGESLIISRGGIVLGADVTFKDISLDFANAVRNAIIANGHTLTLENVKQTGAYTVHLFCGGVTDTTTITDNTLPDTGSNGEIIIKGTNDLGNIYAGSLSDVSDNSVIANTYSGSATVTVEAGASGFGEIYAHGAREPRGKGDGSDMTPDSTNYTVTGGVTINLSNTTATVYGATGGDKNATVIHTDNSSGNLAIHTLYDIGALTLKNTGAKLAPAAGSTISAGAAVTIPSGTRLDLSSLGSSVTIGSFAGGGTLVLGASQALTITDAVSGTTSVAVGSVSFDGTDSTGTITAGQTYITAAGSAADSFTLLSDSYTLQREDGGVWKAAEGTAAEVKISDFSLEDAAVTTSASSASLALNITFADSEAYAGEFLYIEGITVAVNGTDAPYDGDEEYAYVDATNGLALGFAGDDEITLLVSPSVASGNLYLPKGNYEITVTVLAAHTITGQAITKTATLTVDEPAALPKEFQAEITTPENATYDCSEKKPTISVKDGNTELDEGTHYTVTYKRGDEVTTDFTSAGEITVTVTGKGDYAGTATATYTINAASLTGATVTAAAQTYTGSKLTPEVTVTLTGLAPTENDYDVTYSPDTLTNAGEYTVTIIGKGNFTGTATGSFTITPANASNLTATSADQTTVYGAGDFTEPTFTGLVNEAVTGTLTYSITAANGATAVTNGNAAAVKESLAKLNADASVTVNWTFTPTASGNYTGSKTGSFTVTARDIEFKVGNTAASEDNAINVLTSSTEYGKTWTERISVDTAAITASVGGADKPGTYTIVPADGALTDRPGVGTHTYTVTFTSTDGSYTNVTVFTGSLAVTAKPVTITGLTATDRAYDGTVSVTLTGGTVSGKVGDDDLTIDLTGASGTMDDANAGNNKTVTVGGVALGGADAGNYELKEQPTGVTVNISKKDVSITGAAVSDKNYDGTTTATVTSVDFTGLIGNTTLTKDTDYEVTSATFPDANADAANVGVTITVALKGDATTNYDLTNGVGYIAVGAAKINKIDWDGVTAAAGEARFGDSGDVNMSNLLAPGASFGAVSVTSGSGLLDGTPAVSGSDLSFKFASTATVGQTATVTIAVGEGTNHTGYTVTVTLTVLAKHTQSDFGFASSTQTKTYGDAPFTAAATGAATGSTVTYESSDTTIAAVDGATGKVTILKAGGPVTITATAAETDDYAPAAATYTLTVEKATITITANDKTVTVNGTMPTFDYTITGLASGDTLTTAPTFACSAADTKTVGTYDIIPAGAVVPNTDNYNASINYTNGTLTVKAQSSGGGGGGGYTPSTPPATSITVPISGDEETIHVDASVSGSKATVDEVDLSKLDTVIGDDVTTGTVTIDFSGLDTSKPITTVEIPSDVVKQIAEAVNNPNNDAQSLEVILSDGTSIEFDTVALGKKAAQADGLDITISIEHYEDAKLTSAQKDAVGSRPAYDINVTSGGKRISDIGGRITIHAPYELRPGEKPRGIVVWYVDDHGNRKRCETSYDSAKKRVNWKTDHLSLYMIDYDEVLAANPFTDVAEDAYYFDAVLWAVENGIANGTGDGSTFSPDASCTRAQMATFLWRAAGSPDPAGGANPFTDVPADAYYATAVQWAVEKGITVGTGDGTTFSPDASCTRAQMATFLWRNAGSPDPAGSVNPFTDVAADAYYTKVVQWAVEQGITVGTGDGTTFSPDNPCTRSQMVTFLYRYFEK